MKWLDLFCGEGCVADGLFKSGAKEVYGIDLNRKAMKYYPGNFPRPMNVLEAFEWPLTGIMSLEWVGIDAIWASPPCLEHTELNTKTDRKGSHPDLITPTREWLKKTGKPYIIENVPDAPLINPIELCGCMFGLGVTVNGVFFSLERPRIFECSFPVRQPKHYRHCKPVICAIGGHARNRSREHGGRGTADFTDFETPKGKRHRLLLGRAFGIPDDRKITCKGITDGIPPVYAAYMAARLYDHIGVG